MRSTGQNTPCIPYIPDPCLLCSAGECGSTDYVDHVSGTTAGRFLYFTNRFKAFIVHHCINHASLGVLDNGHRMIKCILLYITLYIIVYIVVELLNRQFSMLSHVNATLITSRNHATLVDSLTLCCRPGHSTDNATQLRRVAVRSLISHQSRTSLSLMN
jgi:hypothetical protein